MITTVKAFFRLVRWFHELLAILPFLGLYLVILYAAQQQGLTSVPPVFDFAMLCFCVQLLLAAGCVLNDIVDRDIDKINKPRTHIVGNTISLKAAWWIFGTLSVLAFICSVYISVFLFREWAYISVAVYTLSILYDVYFKRSPLMGNVLMALLSSFVPLVLFFFAKTSIAALNNQKINTLICLYAAFPFPIIIARELSLDISDMEGDKACGCRTLPIVIGAKRSKLVITFILLLTIGAGTVAAWHLPYLRFWFLLVNSLLAVYLLLLQKTETRIQYIRIGRFLWFAMIFGLIGFTVATVL